MSKWGAALFVVFESKVSRRKMGVSSVGGCLFGVCWWVSLQCGDADRFFDGVKKGEGFVICRCVSEISVGKEAIQMYIF